MNKEKKRWQYRFDNFKRAYFLLQEAIEQYNAGELNQLGKEGAIRRFKTCIELSYSTIKDYMKNQHIALSQITPNTVIKEAIAAKIISDGENWMKTLDARNEMSHTYDFKKFEAVLEAVKTSYLNCFGQLYEKLGAEYDEN